MDASCLSPDTLLAWVDGRLGDGERTTALAHVDQCARCREALAALARIATVTGEHGAEPDREPRGALEAFGVGARLGRFRITRMLGVGGMGIVVGARDQRLGRDVAIKVVRPELASKLGPRFLREARAAAAIHHPNLVGILDLGEVDGVPYLVMELVEGVTLRAWVAGTRPSRDAALAACVAAGRGLAALHAAGHLHRDVKPDNVLVARDGRVLLADFGLAKPIDAPGEHLTRTGAIVGTPGYLAPERAAGEPADVRADIYAFGAMTIEMVRACTDVPLRPHLLGVLSRATELDPAARWPSMDALLAALAPARSYRRAALLAAVPIAVAVVAGGTWLALHGDARPAREVPAPARVRVEEPRVVATVFDAAIGAVVDATHDRGVRDAAVGAGGDATRRAVAAPSPDAAGSDAAGGDATALDAGLVAGGTQLTIEFLQSLGLGPAKSADAEAEVMARHDGVCSRGAPNQPLGWDWGPVERRELVDVALSDGRTTTLYLYQIKGQDQRYLIDGAYSTRAYLDVPVGKLVLVCPWKPRSDVAIPAGWQGELVWSVYFGGPIAGPSPVLAKRPEIRRGAPSRDWDGGRPSLFLLRKRPEETKRGLRDMGHYFLDASPAHGALIDRARERPVWVLATYAGTHERYGTPYALLRVVDVRRTLFDPE